MADIKKIFTTVLTLADSVNDYLPGAAVSQGAINLARKMGDVIDSFGDDIPLEQQGAAQAARKQLAEAVKAKAAATSDRLRGEH